MANLGDPLPEANPGTHYRRQFRRPTSGGKSEDPLPVANLGDPLPEVNPGTHFRRQIRGLTSGGPLLEVNPRTHFRWQIWGTQFRRQIRGTHFRRQIRGPTSQGKFGYPLLDVNPGLWCLESNCRETVKWDSRRNPF